MKLPSTKAESKDVLNVKIVRTTYFDFVKIKEINVGAGPLGLREEKKN